ncbi:hypothetical protein Veis_3472 [Verminephrobacter eiseniae EF01-2]|uniref:Uncharacterized protein n=1 Tax=Verminephrobacter eiseniae (strain EF01-2) TaxID=391735 RepID=A1WNI6_VEREI|nr:hypothetical protein Veis_3472 [Verminephrobacter eiseniae EF01-2]
MQGLSLTGIQGEALAVVGVKHGLHALRVRGVASGIQAVERPRPALPYLRFDLLKKSVCHRLCLFGRYAQFLVRVHLCSS